MWALFYLFTPCKLHLVLQLKLRWLIRREELQRKRTNTAIFSVALQLKKHQYCCTLELIPNSSSNLYLYISFIWRVFSKLSVKSDFICTSRQRQICKQNGVVNYEQVIELFKIIHCAERTFFKHKSQFLFSTSNSDIVTWCMLDIRMHHHIKCTNKNMNYLF